AFDLTNATVNVRTLIDTPTLTLPGALVVTQNGALTSTQALLKLAPGATLTGSQDAVLTFAGGVVTSGADLVDLGEGAQLSLSGRLASVAGTTLNVNGAMLHGTSATVTPPTGQSMLLLQGANVTTQSLLDLTSMVLDLGANSFATITSGGTVTFTGSGVKL